MGRYFYKIQDLFKDDSGATAIEYSLIGALFILVIIVALGDVGFDVDGLYTEGVGENIGGAIGDARADNDG